MSCEIVKTKRHVKTEERRAKSEVGTRTLSRLEVSIPTVRDM